MPDSYLNLSGEILTQTGIRNSGAKTVWLANGGFVVLWTTSLTTSGPLIPSFQLYSADGNKIDGPIAVDDPTGVGTTRIAALTGGNFVVTWLDNGAYAAKIYSPTGTVVGSEFTIASSGSPQTGPLVALSDGGFLATWNSGATVSHAQRYDAAGATVGSAFDIVSGAAVNSAVVLANGDCLFTWTQSNSVFAAEFTAAGAAVGSAFQIDSGAAGTRTGASVAALANGGYVVEWTDASGTGGDSDNAVHARVYDATGTAVSGDFVVNATTAGSQSGASIVALPSGGFFAAWTDASGTGGDSDIGIKGQYFDDSGNRVGDEFLVNTTIPNTQTGVGLSVSDDGVIAISWIDNSTLGSTAGPPTTAAEVRVQLMVPTTMTVDTYNGTTEFAASTDIASFASVTALAGGGYAVSWEIQDFNGTTSSVQTRVFDSSGHGIGSEVAVSDSANIPTQINSDTAALTGGNYVVVWNDDGPGTPPSISAENFDVRAQIMDASGNTVGASFQVNSTTIHGQLTPTATGLSNGGFVVTWSDASATGGDTDGSAIRAQIFNAAGTAVGGEFLVNTVTAGSQTYSDVASLSGDRFLVTWWGGTGASSSVRAQIYNNDGTTVGSEITVGAGERPAAVGLSGGGFVVISQLLVSGVYDVRAQLYDSAGHAVGSAFTVNTNLTGSQQLADIAALDDGGFVVTWFDQYSPLSTSSASISAQIFDSAGVRVGSEFSVGSASSFNHQPAITQLDGGFAIAWAANNGIETRLFSESTGTPVVHDDAFSADELTVVTGNVFADNGAGLDAFPVGNVGRVTGVNGVTLAVGQMITLASGAHLTINRAGTFTYDPNGAFDYLAAAATATDSFTYGVSGGLSSTATVTINGLGPGPGYIEGTTGDDVLVGTAASETLVGLQGNDQLYALGGNDVVKGQAGNDYLDGGSGADGMIGGLGDDTYSVDDDGDTVTEAAGEGFDIVYSSINYSLAAGAEVEVLSGSDFSQTTPLNLAGNAFGQQIFGNNGDNFLIGGGGADALYGGLGDDTYSVDTQDVVFDTGGYDTIYSSTNFQLNAGAEIEVLSANDFAATTPLNLAGNELDQSIFGNAGKNFLIAGAGADGLYGKGGNDTYSVDGLDVVVENAHEGYDTVYTSSSFALGAGSEIEVLSVSDYAATTAINLTGNAIAQQIIGNAGANILDGGGANDQLVGRGGADTFAFTTALGATNVDTVSDFVSGLDNIALDDAVFTGLGPGALSASAFVIGTAAGDADDRIIYNGNQLFYDADGNGAGAAVLFATLTGQPTIAASDFVVI